MAYLFLILLALLTPMATYFVSDQMIYRFHYHPPGPFEPVVLET